MLKFGVDYVRNYKIEIENCKDYERFFQLCTQKGVLKKEYKGNQINFYIHLENIESKKVDELLFFYYCLIANRYSEDAGFRAIVVIDTTFERFQKSSNYYRINTFLYLQLKGVLKDSFFLLCNTGKKEKKEYRRWQLRDLLGIGRLLPLFTINVELLELIQRPITLEMWEKIKSFPEKELSTIEDMLIHLCHRFLFREIENELLTWKLRSAAFALDSFFEAIQGLPLLALVIFAVFDYFYRSDLAMLCKERIKEKTGGTNILLTPSDLIEGWQDTQKYERYVIHREMCREDLNIKTILTTSNRDKLVRKNQVFLEKLDSKTLYVEIHSKLVGELYEAVSIAEGLIQLVENTVYHAGHGQAGEHKSGEGMLSMHIHRVVKNKGLNISEHLWDDTDDLDKHYKQYIERHEKQAIEKNFVERPVRYYLEVKLADISSTDIASKFKDNHHGYISASIDKDVFCAFNLESFFAPSTKENIAWERFYQHATHIVNHYGLQIFNSTVRSKDGFFYVTSQGEQYCSLGDCAQSDVTPFIHGTAYTVLLPLSAHISNVNNIYDSMLEYNLLGPLKQNPTVLPIKVEDGGAIQSQEDKEKYVDSIYTLLERTDVHAIKAIDISSARHIECVVKGVMRYVYQHRQEHTRFALINCRSCEMVNIVRLFSLFYNRQAQNNQMENTQIYIRGKMVGEELLFYGKELPEVENNIAKMACMRGILYENYRVLHEIFHRETVERD